MGWFDFANKLIFNEKIMQFTMVVLHTLHTLCDLLLNIFFVPFVDKLFFNMFGLVK